MSDRLRALERENLVLARKVERLTANLARLEDQREANSRFLHAVVEQMQAKEADLVENNAALLAATSAKSIFLANMSHELRTPLNAVIGYAELLTDDPSMAGGVHELSAIIRAGRGLLGLLADILDLTKIESGHLELEERSFLLAQLVRDVVDTIEPAARTQGLALVVEVADGSLQLRGDELRVRQILTNLLSNAVKFTPSGTVTLRVGRVGDTLEFVVRDTGIGLTDEALHKIFDPFVQADVSTTRRFGGTGLGLSIARRLTQRMGGQLAVESTPGRGTTFTLELPCQVLEADQAPIATSPGACACTPAR